MAEQQTNRDESDPPGPADASGEAERDTDVSWEAVAQNLGGVYWWVDNCRWATVQPALADDLVALLASPILVGTAPVRSADPVSRPA